VFALYYREYIYYLKSNFPLYFARRMSLPSVQNNQPEHWNSTCCSAQFIFGFVFHVFRTHTSSFAKSIAVQMCFRKPAFAMHLV
jgi:hypothetical protein